MEDPPGGDFRIRVRNPREKPELDPTFHKKPDPLLHDENEEKVILFEILLLYHFNNISILIDFKVN